MANEAVKHDVTGLFGGIGGIELGLGRAGHSASLFCECDPEAVSVLRTRFPKVPVNLDVRKTDELIEAISEKSDLLTAGFPCTDFSQAGDTLGFKGGRSSLIIDTLRLLRRRPFQHVILENVPNWRHLHRGNYMRRVVNELEALGYRWAYRTIDSRAFGLPQRRLRIFLYATLSGDPREVLFHGNQASVAGELGLTEAAHGFYWTEGNRGLGWGEDCVPTLKGGSALAIPSPPAILMPNLSIITPDIVDCERLQGFAAGWTHLEERSALVGGGEFRPRRRWLLVGNAVNVEVAEWLGHRLANRVAYEGPQGTRLAKTGAWPAAAWSDGKKRWAADVGPWPVARESKPLADFLTRPGQPLSLRATTGFYARIEASSLRFKTGFKEAVKAHRDRMNETPPTPAVATVTGPEPCEVAEAA